MKKKLKSGILSADKSADGRPTVGGVNVIAVLSADCQNPKNVGRWKINYNKVVITYFLSADEKRAKIWHLSDKLADCRSTVGVVNVIAV